VDAAAMSFELHEWGIHIVILSADGGMPRYG
jgi:hypothetical protein